MPKDDAAYVERYGWSRRSGSAMIAGAVLVTAGIGFWVPLAVSASFLGAGVVLLLGGMLGRRVALRVDAAGITLGGRPLRYRATTLAVPWADIATVVLWQRMQPAGTSLRYVGLARRAGAPPLPPTAAPVRHPPGPGMTAPADPGLPAEVVRASRAVTGWQLDEDRLVRAVARFGPGAEVLDADSRRFLGPPGA